LTVQRRAYSAPNFIRTQRASSAPADEVAMSKAALRISDLPIGKTKAYEEIRAGRLRAVKCGKLTLILAVDYERWLTSLPPIKAVPAESLVERTLVSGKGNHHVRGKSFIGDQACNSGWLSKKKGETNDNRR
jgi:hypothetical protein